MKIWIAASIPENSTGGVHRSMQMIGGGLKQKGHEVYLLFNTTGENYLQFSINCAIRLIRAGKNRPHWIIARSTDGVFCALIARVFGYKTRVIIHNHGWEEKAFALEKSLPVSVITNPTTWKSRLIRFPLLRLNLQLATCCMCGTLEEGRWITGRYHGQKKKVIIIPNGITVDKKPFWPQKDHYPLHFLMVGGNTWKKNIEYGIAVFENIRINYSYATLQIIGCHKEDFTVQKNLPEAGSVQFIEQVAPNMMDTYYESCPFLLFTSRYEGGHAFTVLEAQAKGMVVFATPIPSTREIITDRKNGFFISGINPEKDAALIGKVGTDIDTIRKTGEAAFRSALRNRSDRQIERLHSALLKKSPYQF